METERVGQGQIKRFGPVEEGRAKCKQVGRGVFVEQRSPVSRLLEDLAPGTKFNRNTEAYVIKASGRSGTDHQAVRYSDMFDILQFEISQ